LGLRARRRDVRKVDDQARKGLVHIFQEKGPDAIVKYRPVDGALRAAYPQHRPPQRHTDTIRFIEEGILAPYAMLKPDGKIEVVRVSDPHPLFVPTYVYGRGVLLGASS
ncbi:MAG: hypothetical protein ACREB9_07440, partial [Thermoplasmata archaeon]